MDARTNMPGFSVPSGFSTLTRTFTVRVPSSSTGWMKAIVPLKVFPG